MTHEWTDVDSFPGLSVRFTRNSMGRFVIAGLRLEAEVVTADLLRRIPLRVIQETANLGVVAAQPQPVRRADCATAEEFSERVAGWYGAWAVRSPRPAAEMARQADVKLPTVHSWIREARLRGLLPHARERAVRT